MKSTKSIAASAGVAAALLAGGPQAAASEEATASLSPNLPRHPAATHHRGELLPQALLDHGLPRHQGEWP